MPPVDDEYQRTVAPVLAVALKVTVPLPHLEAGVVPVMVGSSTGMTVAVTDERKDETQSVLELYASA